MENIDATIIYYTSNREHPKFEKRIQEKLIENSGGLPIISVSQKPIKLGKNIVVGDVGVSGFNMFRQVQIACREAKTKYVISAEADCVYPPDYFTFRPLRDDKCFRNSNLYVMGDHRDYWYYKGEGATHAQIVGREYYLKVLDKLFEGCPEWNPNEKNFPKERYRRSDVFWPQQIEYYRTKYPVFQIKTHRSMRYFTSSSRIPVYNLPYWGEGKQIRQKYMEGVKEIYAQIKN